MASPLTPPLDITLYRGFPGSGKYVWSPFVTKLEARLRFAGLSSSYRTEAGSLSKAPKGKIPYVSIISSKTDAGSGVSAGPPTVLADSTLIIQKLVEDGVVEDLNAGLSPTEKAHDLALQALLEDKLYFYQNHERWHENYYAMRSGVLSSLPYPLQIIVGLLAHRGIMQTLHGQGTARFSGQEISSFRERIWENVNALLVTARGKTMSTMTTKEGGEEAKAPFWVLGGKGPSEADATVFGFVAAAMVCDAAPETNQVVRGFPAVVDYARRIHDVYFPDYECWE